MPDEKMKNILFRAFDIGERQAKEDTTNKYSAVVSVGELQDLLKQLQCLIKENYTLNSKILGREEIIEISHSMLNTVYAPKLRFLITTKLIEDLADALLSAGQIKKVDVEAIKKAIDNESDSGKHCKFCYRSPERWDIPCNCVDGHLSQNHFLAIKITDYLKGEE